MWLIFCYVKNKRSVKFVGKISYYLRRYTIFMECKCAYFMNITGDIVDGFLKEFIIRIQMITSLQKSVTTIISIH